MISDWRDYFKRLDYLFACPIVDKSRGVETVVGTASYLMPGVFFTAKHVVDEWHTRSTGKHIFQSEGAKAGDADGLDVKIVHILKDDRRIVWQVSKSMAVPDYDVSILLCEYYGESVNKLIRAGVLQSVCVDLHPPAENDQVVALGYPNPLSSPTNHHVNLRAAYGGVVDILYSGTPKVKNPCFQINAEVESSMSGGPVFNKIGKLCGIISSALDPPIPEYTVFISLLWRALIVDLPTNMLSGNPVNLLEASKRGFFELEGWAHLSKSTNGDYVWSELAPTCRSCKEI